MKGRGDVSQDIYLTDGASAGVKTVLEAFALVMLLLRPQVMIGSPLDGVLIPIPQYPLYSALVSASYECIRSLEAAITRLGGTFIGYELLEDYTSGQGIHIGRC